MSGDVTLAWDGILTIAVPSDWQSEELDGLISIFNPQGAGALQFSFATGPTDELADVERQLSSLAGTIGLRKRAQPSRTQLGGWDAAYVEGCSGGKDPEFWRVWVAARPGKTASVTYNCPATDEAAEKDQIDRVLASARLT